MSQLAEFQEVFGMRFVGLSDDAGVYTSWRVPNPTAPYPQDYVIDQEGYVRYWSDRYDPQEVMRVIDRLLASGDCRIVSILECTPKKRTRRLLFL